MRWRASWPILALRPGPSVSRWDQRSVGLSFIELAVAARCALAKLPYGDQALFLPRELFNQIGGYPMQPIMEDVELVQRLKAHGKIRISRLPAITSARRWRTAGVFRTTALNYFMMIARLMGGDLGYSAQDLRSAGHTRPTARDQMRSDNLSE